MTATLNRYLPYILVMVVLSYAAAHIFF